MTADQNMPRVGLGWKKALASIEANCKVRNWDSYHADPVDQRAIDAARRLCESLYVFPTKNGGVSVILAGEDVSIELTDEGQLEDFYLSVTDVNRYLRSPACDCDEGVHHAHELCDDTCTMRICAAQPDEGASP